MLIYIIICNRFKYVGKYKHKYLIVVRNNMNSPKLNIFLTDFLRFFSIQYISSLPEKIKKIKLDFITFIITSKQRHLFCIVRTTRELSNVHCFTSRSLRALTVCLLQSPVDSDTSLRNIL